MKLAVNSEEGNQTESITPSDSIIKCNGQDISRKGGKSKPLMVVLPADLSFKKNAEGDFAYIENLNSAQPNLVMEVEGGILRFAGKFVDTRAAFLSIEIHPSKKQSVCNDLTSRILVFDPPTYTTIDESECATEMHEKTPLSPDPPSEEHWLKHFGCSAAAQPQTVKSSALQRSRLSSISSVLSQQSAKENRKRSMPEGRKRSKEEEKVKSDSLVKSDKGASEVPLRRGYGYDSEENMSKLDNGPSRQGARKKKRVSYVESSEGSEDEDDDTLSQGSSWDDD